MGTLSQEQIALLTDYDPASAYTVAYNTAYANIRFSWDSAQIKPQTILLATPATYPGQATAPANIAIAAAQNGTPTILVDANLRSPSLHQRFSMGEQKGLSDLLQNGIISAQQVAAHVSQTFIPDLHLLGAGSRSPQPAEISRILSARLNAVITGLCEFLNSSESRASLIVFNSPPILSAIDAALISALVDQTFLVVAAGRTTRTQARRAQEQFERAHAKLAGVIMLDV